VREEIPDPNDEATFRRAKLDWTWSPPQEEWNAYIRFLLQRRCEYIVPRLAGIYGAAGRFELLEGRALRVSWRLRDDLLILVANMGVHDVRNVTVPVMPAFAATGEDVALALGHGTLPAWSAAWYLAPVGGA
jgi:hypothetical protein